MHTDTGCWTLTSASY